MRRVVYGLGAISALFGACSPFTAADEPAKAPNDAGALDGAPAGDTGASPGDPEAGADASGPLGCARYPSALFCDDFESTSDLATRWSIDNGSAQVLETRTVEGAPSPSHVAHFSVPNGTYICANDWLSNNRGASFTKAHFAFSALIGDPFPASPDNAVEIALLGFDDGNLSTLHRVQEILAIKPTETYVHEQWGGLVNNKMNLVSPFPIGRWVRVDEDLDLAKGTFAIGFDGKPAASFAIAAPIGKAGVHLTFGVGFPCYYVGRELYVDDVVVTYD